MAYLKGIIFVPLEIINLLKSKNLLLKSNKFQPISFNKRSKYTLTPFLFLIGFKSIIHSEVLINNKYYLKM